MIAVNRKKMLAYLENCSRRNFGRKVIKLYFAVDTELSQKLLEVLMPLTTPWMAAPMAWPAWRVNEAELSNALYGLVKEGAPWVRRTPWGCAWFLKTICRDPSAWSIQSAWNINSQANPPASDDYVCQKNLHQSCLSRSHAGPWFGRLRPNNNLHSDNATLGSLKLLKFF